MDYEVAVEVDQRKPKERLVMKRTV